jgi:DNA polymerase I-like protein with 3'-5' exonuclease and polymerase domains
MKFGELRKRIERHGVVSIDLETKAPPGEDPKESKNPRKAHLELIALAAGRGSDYYSIAVDPTPEAVDFTRQCLANPGLRVVGHNIVQFDLRVLHHRGIYDIHQVRAKVIDTLVLSWLLNEEIPHGLKFLVKKVFRHDMVEYEEAFLYSNAIRQMQAAERVIADAERQKGEIDDRLRKEGEAERRRLLAELKSKYNARKKENREKIANLKEKIDLYVESGYGEQVREALREKIQNQIDDLQGSIVHLRAEADRDKRTYACDDAKQTLRLYYYCRNRIYEEGIPDWAEREIQSVFGAAAMEAAGIHVEPERLQELDAVFDPLIEEFEADLFNLAHTEFNPNSTDQVGHILYDVLRLPDYSGGKRKTNVHILSRLKHPIAQAILNYRSITKLRSTYVVKLLERSLQDPEHRIFARFNPVGAVTGRASSSNPNLQNIPSRKKPKEYDERIQGLGPKIRWVFNAAKGRKLICADLSQIELRLIAYVTRDPVFLKIYSERAVHNNILYYTGDVHETTRRAVSEIVGFDIGRKLAKCLDGSTIVHADGTLRLIESILVGIEPDEHRSIPPIDLADGRGGFVKSRQGLVRHDRPCRIVVTKRGVVCCTDDHRWKTEDGYLIEARHLKPGMKIPVAEIPIIRDTHPRTVRVNPFTRRIEERGASLALNEDWAYFAGLFHGDGSMTNDHACCITHGSDDRYAPWRCTVSEACKKIGLNPSRSGDLRYTYLGSRTVVRLLADLGLVKGRNKDMRVPWWVVEGGRRIICAYLAGLIDTDGTVGVDVSITQKDPIFIGQIAVLLRSIGCPISIEPSWNKTYRRWYYRLHLLAPGFETANDEIPLREQNKKARLEARAAKVCKRARKIEDEVRLVIDAGRRTVYDFHIENDDHLYLQGGLLGHNNLNFGLMYGLGAEGFARYAGLFLPDMSYDVQSSTKFINAFMRLYVKIPETIEDLEEQWLRGVHKFTLVSGRQRHFNPKDDVQPGKIFNSIIQGSAADFLKCIISSVYANIVRSGAFGDSKIVLQVHDEIMLDVPESLAEDIAVLTKYIMELPWFDIVVPVLASVKVCDDWSEKDNDDVPEVGSVPPAETGIKPSVAMLSDAQRVWASKYVSDYRQYRTARSEPDTMSVEEYLRTGGR